jgi:ABC-2 type transport system permease protein/lipopolysaccharide transport system permease protein
MDAVRTTQNGATLNGVVSNGAASAGRAVRGDAHEVPDAPPRELRYHRRLRPGAVVRELLHARELIWTLAEREVRARYKQTILGFAWALITPVTLMLAFTLFFDRVADIDTGGAPYALYSYVALLPWTFFSNSVSQGGQSLTSNLALLNKVYCPREVFPLGSIAVAALDTLVATAVLGVLFGALQYAPRPESIAVPALLAVQVAFTVGVALIVSVVTVYLRDLRQALPIILQFGLFATPVAYGMDAVPSWARPVYSFLNPLAPVIDGYRRTVLLGRPPDWDLLAIGAVSASLVLVGGYVLFKRLETGIADVA